LALEPVSDFCKYFLPVFARHPEAILEIRTKSTQIRSLLEQSAIKNCVVAMSFTAKEAGDQWEHKVPSIEKRIETLRKLQEAGWKVAIRFEPLILGANSIEGYRLLFKKLFAALDVENIHSVSCGLFRMPVDFHKRIVKLYPDEELFARPATTNEGMIALKNEHEGSQLAEVEQQLFEYISPQQYYRCA